MRKGIITVVGSFVVDLMSRTPRMPKTGETVLGGPFRMGPGGKGSNQAVAAARQGAEVYMVTKVGNDEFGVIAQKNFKNEKIFTQYVFTDPVESTGAALIAVDKNGDNMIVVALGACGNLCAADVTQAEEAIKNSSIVLLQLETSIEAVAKTVEIAAKHDIPVILNPAPYQEFPQELLKSISYVTPNETEASQLTGIAVTDEASAFQAAKHIYGMGVSNVIITLGESGCYFYAGSIVGLLYPAFKMEVIDTTGAGDAFNGGLAYALASGQRLEEAIKYANAVAALSVIKIGTAPAMPTKEDVMAFLNS